MSAAEISSGSGPRACSAWVCRCPGCSGPRLGAVAERAAGPRRLADLRLPPRRHEHDRHLGHEARRAGRVPRRVQADRDQGARHRDLRAHAPARGADGQGLADPLVPARQLEPRSGRPLHADRLPPDGRVQPDLRPNNQRPAHRGDHRPEARAEGLGAAVRLPAQDAPEHRLGLPRRGGGAVRDRRRPERPRFRRARRRAAARAGAGPAGVAAGAAGPGRPLPAQPPRRPRAATRSRWARSARRRST